MSRRSPQRATPFSVVTTALSTALSNIGAVFTSTASQSVRQLSLVPYYLTHLLWLLEGKFLDLVTKGYGQNPAVYACIRVLCQAVPEPPLVPRAINAQGEPDEPLPWMHPLRQLIRHPNPFQTEYQFWAFCVLHTAVTGRSLWWKERDQIGRILHLWPLRPDRCGPIYARADDPDPVLLGWSYLIPGTTHYLAIPANDVVMFLSPDPAGESGGLVEGLGPLQVLKQEIGADNVATEFVGSLIANYAVPGVVLEVPNQITDPDVAKRLKQAFMEDFGGAKRGQPMIADHGAKVTQLGFSLKDLEFKGLRSISESRISAVFGVPAVLAGLLVGLDASSTNATVDELRAFFAETTCDSYWRQFGEAYGKYVASEYEEDCACVFDLTKVKALMSQAYARIDRAAAAYTSGAITVDEYREVLGWEKLPHGAGERLATGIALGRGTETYIQPGQQDPNQDVPENVPEGQSAEPGEQAQQGQEAQQPKPAARSTHALPVDQTHAHQEAEGVEALRAAFADLDRELAGNST